MSFGFCKQKHLQNWQVEKLLEYWVDFWYMKSKPTESIEIIPKMRQVRFDCSRKKIPPRFFFHGIFFFSMNDAAPKNICWFLLLKYSEYSHFYHTAISRNVWHFKCHHSSERLFKSWITTIELKYNELFRRKKKLI